jgi:hypothetical protein
MPASVANIGTYLGTAQSSTIDSSLSVTVPSGASLCVVCVTGYCGPNSGSHLLDQLAFRDGYLDFTHVVTGYYATTADPQVSIYYLKSSDAQYPAAGAQTLHYRSRTGNAWSEGANICVFFLNDIDITGDPVVGVDSSNGTQASWDSNITGASANDIGICCGYGYLSDVDADPAGYNQTAIWEPSVYNSAEIGVGYEVGAGAGALRIGRTGNEIVGAAVVFRGSAASGGVPIISLDGSGTFSSDFDGTSGAYSGGYINVTGDGMFFAKTDLGVSNWWGRFQRQTIGDEVVGFAIGNASGSGIIYIINLSGDTATVNYEARYDNYTEWQFDYPASNDWFEYTDGMYLGYTVEHSTETVRIWFNVTAATPDSIYQWDSRTADIATSVAAWPSGGMSRAGFGAFVGSPGTNQFDNFTAGVFGSSGTQTEKESFGANVDDSNTFGYQTNKTYMAHSFTAGSSYTLSQVGVMIYKNANYTGTVRAYLYSDGTNAPGSLLGISANTVAYTALPSATGTYVNFQFSGVPLTGSSIYWVVLKSEGNSGNGVLWDSDSSGQSMRLMFSDAGYSWSDENSYGATILGTFKTYISGTFGYAGTGSFEDYTNSYIIGSPFTFTGATGSTLGNGHVYVRDSITDHANATLYLGLYASSAGAPTTLLATASLTTTVTTSFAWYTLTGASYSLTNGESYFLMLTSNMGDGFTVSQVHANTITYQQGTSLPNPWSAGEGNGGTVADYQACAYFDYTEPEGGGGGTIGMAGINCSLIIVACSADRGMVIKSA